MLSNDLCASSDLEEGTLRTQRAVPADVCELVFHIHYLFFHSQMAGILIADNSEVLKPDEQSESITPPERVMWEVQHQHTNPDKCLTANKSCNYT